MKEREEREEREDREDREEIEEREEREERKESWICAKISVNSYSVGYSELSHTQFGKLKFHICWRPPSEDV